MTHLKDLTQPGYRGAVARDDVVFDYPSFTAMDDEGYVPCTNREPFANTICLMVTNECPVMCAHCLAHSGGKLRGHASPEHLRRVIEEAAQTRTVGKILFTGGEPFAALEQLRYGLELSRGLGLANWIATSANWATSVETAHALLSPLQPLIDILFVTIDLYHQRRVPIEYVRNAIRGALALRLGVVILNPMSRDELAAGLRLSRLARELADEFKLPIQAWPMFDIGRGSNLRRIMPPVQADQPCGLTNKPHFYTNGDVHACCAGAGLFAPGHPLYAGNLHDAPADVLIEKMSRSLLVQGIRAIGPVRMLEALGLPHAGFETLCQACNHLTAQPEVEARFTRALEQNPDLFEYIQRFREISGDLEPAAHCAGSEGRA